MGSEMCIRDRSGGMSRADSAMAVMVASIERTVKEMAELMRLQQGVISTTNAQAGATAALNDELQRFSTTNMRFTSSFRGVQDGMGGAAQTVTDFKAATGGASASLGNMNEHVLAWQQHMADAKTQQGGLVEVTERAARETRKLSVAQMAVNEALMGQGRVVGMLRPALVSLVGVLGSLATVGGAVAGAGYFLAFRSMQQDIGKVTEELGLNEKQLKRLKAAGIETGIIFTDSFRALGTTIKQTFESEIAGATKVWNDFLDDQTIKTANDLKELVGIFRGFFGAIKAIWSQLPAAIGDAAVTAANAVLKAMEGMINGGIGALNEFFATLKAAAPYMPGGGALGLLPTLGTIEIGEIRNSNAGAARRAGEAAGKAYAEGVAEAGVSVDRFMDRWTKNAEQSAIARIRKAAGERGGPSAEERRAAALARELEAMEATTRANYALATAYGVSDAAALRAAARAEAIGKAIRRQGDIDAFVSAQLLLNASKVAAATAKTIADLKVSAEGRERMNALVAAGTLTERQATDQLALEAELRPIIAAAQAAQGKASDVEMKQVKALTVARKRDLDAQREAELNQARLSNRDRLTVLKLERDLIGANNIERARQLAMLEEEIRLRNLYGKTFINTKSGQSLIANSGANAAFGEQTQRDLARYNLALVEQLDLLRQIDDHTRSAAQGMADAFGSAGRAVGDLAVSMTSYQARLEEIRVAREQMAREGTLNSQREAMFARDAAQAQIQSYGDMMGAAKGFFREGSDGFKILQAAEQGYRIFQFAMSIQSMALTGQETAFTVGQNLIRSASHGVVAVARALASLPFPLNLAAGAATAAALAAIGVKIAGKSGGGGGAGNNVVDESVSTAQAYAETADQARASAAQAVASQVEVRVTADRDGLNAYVVGTAQREAVVVAAPMVAAAAAGTKRDVMDTLKNQQIGNRRAMV